MSFQELSERHRDIIRVERSRGDRQVMGTMCSYVPVEILHSFGILPVRIWGQSDDIGKADALLQQFVCPPVRHLMALGLEGRYDFLDGIVHCYTCDATCGLFNIWVRNLRPRFSHLISLPYAAIDEALAYTMAEFGVLIEKLESLTQTQFSPDSLASSVALYNEARALMKNVYRLLGRGLPISYVDMHAMNVCSQVLPVEAFIPHLKDFLEAAKQTAPVSGKRRRFLLSGSVITDTALLAFVEDLGVKIVADDTCMGLRLLQGAIGEGEPLESLARYYLTRPPCASRADFPSRKSYLLDTLAEYDIDAVAFVHQKFCDPHLSDHPFLKKILDEAGIPNMQLELEGEGFTGRVQTRIESFLEMLETR